MPGWCGTGNEHGTHAPITRSHSSGCCSCRRDCRDFRDFREFGGGGVGGVLGGPAPCVNDGAVDDDELTNQHMHLAVARLENIQTHSKWG